MGEIWSSPSSWVRRLQAVPKRQLLKKVLSSGTRLTNEMMAQQKQRAKQQIKRDLLTPVDEQTQAIPVAWAATTAQTPFANLGDALSPVMVSALSGLPVIHQHFDVDTPRLACVGTIGHGLKNGTVHFWGTGVDRRKNPVDRSFSHYRRPPATQLVVHALRGPFSAEAFQRQGIAVPAVYGDPIWFLPALIPPAPEKRYELGVIVHLSELSSFADTATPKSSFVRYTIPDALKDQVRIITTVTQPTLAALEDRVQEITACKRIISTSLHGMVIAETYQIPCLYLRVKGEGPTFLKLEDCNEFVNLRIRDFYSGLGLKQFFVYGQAIEQETNWEQVIGAIDSYWNPIDWSGEAFLEAFPLPLAFNPLCEDQTLDRALLQGIKF